LPLLAAYKKIDADTVSLTTSAPAAVFPRRGLHPVHIAGFFEKAGMTGRVWHLAGRRAPGIPHHPGQARQSVKLAAGWLLGCRPPRPRFDSGCLREKKATQSGCVGTSILIEVRRTRDGIASLEAAQHGFEPWLAACIPIANPARQLGPIARLDLR